MKIVLDQGSARLHYGVPAALQASSALHSVICDYYYKNSLLDRLSVSSSGLINRSLAKKLRGHCSSQLSKRLVRNKNLRTLTTILAHRACKNPEPELWDLLSKRRSDEGRKTDVSEFTHLHGYISTVSPQLLKWGRMNGIHCSADQIIAASTVLTGTLQQEKEIHGNLDAVENQIDLDRLAKWEELTWPLLDKFTCASDFVKSSLISAGIEKSKIKVIPYPYESSSVKTTRPATKKRTLVIGFLGSVEQRKGIYYYCETAKRLSSRNIKFVAIGPIRISNEIRLKYRDYVTFLGSVPRQEVTLALESFDIFFFPSTAEGSAGVLYEAANARLPIVTSYQSGGHLRNNYEALVSNYSDVESHCSNLHSFISDASLRGQFGHNAFRSLERCTLTSYGAALTQWLEPINNSN